MRIVETFQIPINYLHVLTQVDIVAMIKSRHGVLNTSINGGRNLCLFTPRKCQS